MGVNKSLKRDIQILAKIGKNIEYIDGVIKNSGSTFTQQLNGLYKIYVHSIWHR